MQTKDYKRTIIGIGVISTVLIILLSILLYTQGPRVRLVTFESDPLETTLHKNSSITITFDRPLQNQDYANQISFDPAIEFTAQTSKQSILLTLSENFQSGTEYSLRVNNQIYDQTGRNMNNPHTHTFSVTQPRFVYLERNYGAQFEPGTEVFESDADDHVKLVQIDEGEEILFSAPQISQIAANGEYLVVSVQEGANDRLYSIDLKTKEVREHDLMLTGRIGSLSISPRGPISLFTVTPDFNSVSVEFYEQFANRVESLHLETQEIRTLTFEDGTFLRSFSDIQFDAGGQVALIRDSDETYYAISPFNDYEPILIGARSDSFGFSDTGSEIIFRNNEEFSRYIIETGESSPHIFDSTGFIRDIETANNDIFYSSVYFDFGESRSIIERIEGWDDTEDDTVWANTNYPDSSLREFNLAYDSSLIALQINPTQCTFDMIFTNRRCTTAQTVLYDSQTQEELFSFSGIDLIWLP